MPTAEGRYILENLLILLRAALEKALFRSSIGSGLADHDLPVSSEFHERRHVPLQTGL
jgi:hypothetical protein